MSKAMFVQRRDGRVAALQYLYAWSLNSPSNLTEDLRVFFEGCRDCFDDQVGVAEVEFFFEPFENAGYYFILRIETLKLIVGLGDMPGHLES